MTEERFELTLGKEMMWTVKDNKTGASISFREGLFNESQTVTLPEHMSPAEMMTVHTTMREIGDWVAQNYVEVALCDWQARRTAIWKLANANYWLTMAAATNSLLLYDKDKPNAAMMLYAEVSDYLELTTTQEITDAEEENLKGVLTELTNAEAWEVFRILHVFWNNRTEQDDMMQWAMDVTWWPVWLPEKLKDIAPDDLYIEQ